MAEQTIFIGANSRMRLSLPVRMATRHGLIAGATGTGKTITLQIMAEAFSAAGIPVFAADVKGDLAGISLPGSPTAALHDKLVERARTIGLDDYAYRASPTIFWDLFGKQGHPIRTTISEMGPLLLSRLMDLSEAQEGVLNIAFRLADDEGMLLLDLDDLRAILAHVGEQASRLSATYGHVSRASVGAIQRQLLQLEAQGGEHFFGEPALRIEDFLRTDEKGRGMVNLLAADRLMTSPRLYATFLLWLLSELFEQLPEAGDADAPRLIFFFDEAHLLFDDASGALVEKIEQVVRLIRSKGVGIFFVTQNPLDVPEKVAGQLGNRVQHALRAFTERDRKSVKAAARTFRSNPELDAETAITELGTGEALVSLLAPDGTPQPVERALIRPPASRIGPLETSERSTLRSSSPVGPIYDQPVDRESAYEILKVRGEQAAAAAAEAAESEQAARKERAAERERRRNPSLQDEMIGHVAKAVKRQIANRVAGKIVRGLLGGLFGGRR